MSNYEDYDEPDPYACPKCDSREEPRVEEGKFEGWAVCPSCDATVDSWLTPAGEAERERQHAEQMAAEDAYREQEHRACMAQREAHMSSADCARDVTYHAADDAMRTVTCCDAGWSLQSYAGFYPPWWGEPAEDAGDYDPSEETDLPF